MGDAFICRRGGGALRALVVIAQPSKTSYLSGEFVDMTGAVIGADFGSFVVPIDYTGLYSPTSALTAEDTAITVTATFGHITKSVQIPISVSVVRPAFDENTWSDIATAAATGLAGSIWSIGDSKTENGITYTIIGMNHDNLSSTDAKYRDSSYNRNTKKAALTIQVMTAADRAPMNLTDTNAGGWDTSYMRNTIIPAYLTRMPTDLLAVMRTVDKPTCAGGVNVSAMTTSKDVLFLLALTEMDSARYQHVLPAEASANPTYAYYENGGAAYKGINEFTRSPVNPYASDASGKNFCALASAEGTWYAYADNRIYYLPAFCI